MSNPARVVVLAEDQCQQRFALRYLECLDYSVHDVRFIRLPSGRGSGEQYVRKAYPKEVAVHRRRAVRARKALVVLIDADRESVVLRRSQLADELSRADLDPRSDAERIAHLIPKRNIETWILCLSGETVDEATDYRPNKNISPRIGPAAATFFEWSRPKALVPERCIPSLSESFAEIRRLE